MVRGSCPVCHPSGGVSLVLQSLVGARWSSSGHPTCVFSFLIALFVLASASTRRFGYFMLGFFSGSPSGSGVGVLCFRHGLCDDVFRPLPCSSVGGLHCTGPTNARQSQWENVISCAGGQVFLVRLGGASSAVQAVHVATGCSVKEVSSISVSFWLWMPWHGGAGSRSRNFLFCVPWARCTRAVAPYLLCEELAVILVDGCGCGASAHSCEASASGLLPLGSSQPSTGSVGGGAGPGLTRSCSPASNLVPGPWALLPRLSPAIRLPPMGWLGWGVRVCLHFLKCCLYYFLEILDLISSESLVPSAVTFDSFSPSSS